MIGLPSATAVPHCGPSRPTRRWRSHNSEAGGTPTAMWLFVSVRRARKASSRPRVSGNSGQERYRPRTSPRPTTHAPQTRAITRTDELRCVYVCVTLARAGQSLLACRGNGIPRRPPGSRGLVGSRGRLCEMLVSFHSLCLCVSRPSAGLCNILAPTAVLRRAASVHFPAARFCRPNGSLRIRA